MIQTTIRRILTEGLSGTGSLYVFRASKDVLYIGKSTAIHGRLYDHIVGNPRGNRSLYLAIKNHEPESNLWSIDVYTVYDVLRRYDPEFSLINYKRNWIDRINAQEHEIDMGIFGMWEPAPWWCGLSEYIDRAEQLLITELRPAFNILGNHNGHWPGWLNP